MIEPIIEKKLHKAIKVLSPAYLKKPLNQDAFDTFKTALSTYLQRIDFNASEENFKFHLAHFFNTICPDNLTETKKRIDLITRKGKTNADKAVVLFETKKSSNKSELITLDNLNKKAFHELILYFMRERCNGNTDIKTLIINTQTEFYIFNAQDFERLFYKNTHFKKEFDSYNNGEKTGNQTDFFYKDIATPYIQNCDDKISVTYLNLEDYKSLLNSNDIDDIRKLTHLYKIFSPEFLFSKPIQNDNNSLNKEFYDELLYIVGLHETKEGTRNVIQRLPERGRNPASLIENTISKVTREYYGMDIQFREKYGNKEDERIFNISLELSLIWINRLLFIKLLEVQLVTYHKQNERKFLNLSFIQDYTQLSELFFGALAIHYQERDSVAFNKFKNIPYLNSSLFVKTELEKIVDISGLNNNLALPLFKNTVLTDKKNKPLYTELKTLDYIFKFFDAYDFASDGTKTVVKTPPKTIINASVLGLIFEKINGYKDGSIFTPSYITMLMSKQVIERAVIEKFKQQYNWNINDIYNLNHQIKNSSKDEILEYNALVNSIKICDPAVGSGHFLVSCLNEIIYVKAYLGILADQSGKRIAGYDFELDNDEIIILNDTTGAIYQYVIHQNNVSKNIQHIQKTLFHEKQTIIENCLFGVDINQNSVNICRLRLWIELLKNAYYTEISGYKELETLPNIDINIKCGNALLSRFPLDHALSDAFKDEDFTVTKYRDKVNTYKNTKNKQIKYNLENKIKEIKDHYRKKAIAEATAEIDKDIGIIQRKIITLESQTELFEIPDKILQKQKQAIIKTHQNEIKAKEFEKQKKAYETDLTFEWRFEFPEVLDDNGKFTGFDVVIGNPPYIQLQKDGGELTKLYEHRDYETFVKTGDIYILFYEKGYNLLSPKGILSLITSNKWLRAEYGKKLRTYLCHKTKPLMLIDLGANVFANATVDSNILTVTKRQEKQMAETVIAISIQNDIKTIKNADDLEKIVFNKQIPLTISSDQWIILDKAEIIIKEKLQKIGKSLRDWNIEINYGIKTGYNEAFIIDTPTKNKLCEQDPKSIDILKPVLRGTDIKKWKTDWKGLWVIGTFPALKLKIDDYPAIKKYLELFGEKLNQTGSEFINQQGEKEKTRKKSGNQWFETQDNIAYYRNFEKEKIIYPDISQGINFIYDDKGYFLNNTAYFFNCKNPKYFIAILNSKTTEWFYKTITSSLGNTGSRSFTVFMENLLVPDIAQSEQAPFVALTEQILVLTANDDYNDDYIVSLEKQTRVNTLQAQIDKAVYELYGLTDDEIKIIETSLA